MSCHAGKTAISKDANKPVLAWEREARLKEKHCRDIVQPNPTTIPNGPSNERTHQQKPTAPKHQKKTQKYFKNELQNTKN